MGDPARPLDVGERARKKVLIVEDDQNLREALRYNLVAAGYEVITAADGGSGLELARSRAPDLLLLDLMLPVMDGLDVCRTLRRDGSTVPILMLTARDSESDHVAGLGSGADDYVSKPFSMRELLARVGAQLRRGEMTPRTDGAPEDELISSHGLVIDIAARTAVMDGRELSLRPKEFDLLAFLASSPGRVYRREQLLQQVWGYDYAGDGRTVDVHVRWLRLKIEDDPASPQLLQTLRGVGYRFAR